MRKYVFSQVLKPFNLGIQLSYFRNKANRLQLQISKLELEKSELINEIIRMKLGV
jgi:hypothetical protein